MATLSQTFLKLVTLVGLSVTTVSGYLIVRGPFLGREILDPIPLLEALGAFIVGIVVLAWGGTKYYRSR